MFWRFDVWIDFWQFLKNCRRVSGVTDQCKWKNLLFSIFSNEIFRLFVFFFSKEFQFRLSKLLSWCFLGASLSCEIREEIQNVRIRQTPKKTEKKTGNRPWGYGTCSGGASTRTIALIISQEFCLVNHCLKLLMESYRHPLLWWVETIKFSLPFYLRKKKGFETQ